MDSASNETLVIEAISTALPFFKFNNALETWWKETEENIIELFSYQRSRTQGQFFLNIGLYFERLVPVKKIPPKFTEWHLWTRYDRVMRLSNSEWNIQSTLREDISERAKILHDNIAKIIVPHLDEIAKYQHLAHHLKVDGEFHTYWLQNLRRVDLIAHISQQ